MGAGVSAQQAHALLRQSIAIVGPGAMGCLFGALLAEAGHEVWLVDHRPDRALALSRNGVTIEETGKSRTVPIKATAEPSTIGTVGVILFAVKAYDTEAAARAASALADAQTTIVTLQNGLGNVEILSRAFDPDHVVAGATSHGATLLGTGRVRHAGVGPTVLAPAAGNTERVEAVAELLRSVGLEVTVLADAASVIWSKVVVNASINPLTALTRLRNGQLLEFPELREVLTAVARETAEVARLRGAKLLYEDPTQEVVTVCERTAGNYSSMLQDILAGRETEIGSLNAAVVRQADMAGRNAPINSILCALVRGLRYAQRETPT